MENDFIRYLRERIPGHPQVVLGLGDDAAVLRPNAGKQLVVTTDMLMDGVDFELTQCDPRRAGRKALAVNLSDLAAMAARPVAAFVSLALPRQGGQQVARDLYEGILPLAAEFEIALAGGDTNSWDGPLAISVTALGEVEPGREWRRSGAQEGDWILVTGSFGGSILGKHFDFTPRVREALWLAKHCEVHAAMDVSDGLSLDLSRLLVESGKGAILSPERIPISAAAYQWPAGSTVPAKALDHALSDGEDFELILVVSPAVGQTLVEKQPLSVPLTMIGRVQAGAGLWVTAPSGDLAPLQPRGYEHRLQA